MAAQIAEKKSEWLTTARFTLSSLFSARGAVLVGVRVLLGIFFKCFLGIFYGFRLPHPPSPPSPWYPPLPVKWVVVLFGLVAFPVWSCLASSPPPPVEWDLWSFWLAPPRLWGAVCSTEVWYGCCHLLVAMSSLRALSPPPPVGWGLWSFWLAPPSLCGAVCSTEIWYGCCHLLVVMSSLRARYHTKYDVALFSLQTVRPVPALMRFSAPVKKHWLGSFSIVLPRSGLRGFVPVVRDRREQGPPAAGGRGQGREGGGDTMGGGGGGCGGPGPESIYGELLSPNEGV